jgi:hypothetical protein
MQMNPELLSREYITNNRRDLEQKRFEFAEKHGFRFKRPQDFKNCVTIHWKHRKRKGIDYERIVEHAKIAREICKKYQLLDDKNPFLETALMLVKIGVYCSYSYHDVWAIPNSNKEIQEFVLSKLPKWAEVRHK